MSFFDRAGLAAWTLWQHHRTRVTPERIEAIQTGRLRRLLRYAVERSPFYREKYAGIDVDRCRRSDLPVVGKGELMDRFDDAVTDPRVRRADLERFAADATNAERRFLGRYPVCQTSGSQGQPLLVVMDPAVIDMVFAFQFTRGNPAYGRGPAEILRRLRRPARLAVVASKRGFFPSAAAWNHAPHSVRHFTEQMWVGAGDPDLAEKLNAFRPQILVTYPSAIEVLAVERDRLRLAPELRQVVTAGESLTGPARRRIEEAFGASVTDTYGTGECLFLTNGCCTGPGMHVNADYAILEVVDEEHRPVPPGRIGDKVLLTNLVNRVQPFIRYEIGDQVMMAAEPCGCGSRLPRIERVEGRAADLFWIRSGFGHRPLLTYAFKHAFDGIGEIREWQATQRKRNDILVRLDPLPGATVDMTRARRSLDAQLDAAGLGGEVEIELKTARLGPDPTTGKFRRMVSLVGPPADFGRETEWIPEDVVTTWA